MKSSGHGFLACFFFFLHPPSCHRQWSSPNENLVQTLHHLSSCLSQWKFHAVVHNTWHISAFSASHTLWCSHIDFCGSLILPGCLECRGITDTTDSVPKCPQSQPGETLDHFQGEFRESLHEVFPFPPFSNRTDHCFLFHRFTIPLKYLITLKLKFCLSFLSWDFLDGKTMNYLLFPCIPSAKQTCLNLHVK